jgi:hypothetical protein
MYFVILLRLIVDIQPLDPKEIIPFNMEPPLWCSGKSSWLQIHRSRVRFPALPDFPSSSGYGTGSTQPREDN